MANDNKTSQPTGGDHLGITFGEIHSDEPHEAVKASKTEVAQKHTTSPQSHLSNKDDVFNVTKAYENGHIETGTIVSDRKDSRPSVGSNILSAFSEWWGSAKNTIDDSATKIQAPLMKKEEPVISSVENRSDVVRTAATHATIAPKDDHHIVIQKIRTFKQDVARVQNAPIVVKEQSEKKSGWTHTDQNPVTPAKVVELEKYVASVAAPQKMIPTPPHMEKSSTPSPQPAPIPPPPSSSIPKPPKKVSVPEKVVPPSSTMVTELKRAEAPVRSTPRMSVPETVVKKDVSLPKKNIWVAPRIQPESSVLMPHNSPAPVSQSFIPNQNPLPPQILATPVAPTPTPTPLPPTVPKIVPATPVQIVTPVASIKPVDHGPVKPFHTSTDSVHDGALNVVTEKLTPVPVPSVPQPITPPPTTVPHTPVVPPVQKSPVPEVAHLYVPPQTPHVPASVPTPITPTPTQVPKPVTPPEPHTFISKEQPPRSVPPQILKSSLYKKTISEPAITPTPAPDAVHPPLHAPAPVFQKTSSPRLQDLPKSIAEETRGYANEMPTPSPAPITFRAPIEAPRVASVPLPRPTPVAPPQPRIEVRPVVEERKNPEPVEATPIAFIPRTPAPVPSRPTGMPPLERVISTPVSEQVVTPAPTHNAYRTFVRWAIIVLIILTGITLALFASIYFNVFKKETPDEQTPITVPTFIQTSAQTPLLLEGSKESFLSALRENMEKSGAGLTQFYPTVREGETTRPGSSAEILGFLNTHIDTRTLKSLSPTIMMGSIMTTKNEPFIVLQSSNFDVLFTGLLAWEPYLYSDFSPLFGVTPPSKIKFKDAVRDNTSTRILHDDAGNEILLYSFINQKTVVITTSAEALSKLIKEF